MPLIDEISAALWPVLEERARRLAEPPQADATGDVLDVVVLSLGRERLGVDVRQVQEIQPTGRLTRVPGVPAFWAGLANVRGRLYPVLNLGLYLGLASAPGFTQPGTVLTPPSSPERAARQAPERTEMPEDSGALRLPTRVGGKLVLVAAAGLEIALLVDDVAEVVRLQRSAIGPPLVDKASDHRLAVVGVTCDLLSIVDIETLLADPALVVRDGIA